MPNTEYELKKLDSKEKLLKIFGNNYTMVFSYSHLMTTMQIQNMIKDEIIDDVLEEFFDFINAISITPKEVIKSLAVLIYKIFEGHDKKEDIELFVENVLRIFFDKEIIEINQNKLNDSPPDTFKIDSKIYSKNPYIHSSFDSIPIYGINKENKYYFYKNLSVVITLSKYSMYIKKNRQRKSTFLDNIDTKVAH